MLSKLNQLTLQTERLDIRTAQPSDLEQIYEIHKIEEVNKYLPYDTWQSMTDAQVLFETLNQRRNDNDAEQFVALGRGSVIGTIIVFNYESHCNQAEFGYVLGRPFWGKGYMNEALAKFIPQIIKTLNLAQLNATVEVNNLSSIKLLERLKFDQIGKKVEQDGTNILRFAKRF